MVMTIADYEEKIAKKKEQLAKKTKLRDKYLAEGNDFEAKYRQYDINEIQQTIANYEQKIANLKQKEESISKMPVCIQEFRQKTADAWTRWELELIPKVREAKEEYYAESGRLAKEYNENAWKDRELAKTNRKARNELYDRFSAKWGKFLPLLDMTEEEIKQKNEKEANNLVLDLYERITAHTGIVTDASELYVTAGTMGYAVINGFVKGEKKTVEVRSIGCAGYNIVRWHIRVIVTPIKNGKAVA